MCFGICTFGSTIPIEHNASVKDGGFWLWGTLLKVRWRKVEVSNWIYGAKMQFVWSKYVNCGKTLCIQSE